MDTAGSGQNWLSLVVWIIKYDVLCAHTCSRFYPPSRASCSYLLEVVISSVPSFIFQLFITTFPLKFGLPLLFIHSCLSTPTVISDTPFQLTSLYWISFITWLLYYQSFLQDVRSKTNMLSLSRLLILMPHVFLLDGLFNIIIATNKL